MPRDQIGSGPTDATVAERVRFFREIRGLSVPALSAAIREATGYSYGRTVLSKIEAGTRRVSAHDLVAIAAGLQIAVTDLLMPVVADELELVESSATPDAIAAETFHAWLHARGSGVTSTLAGNIVPVDVIAHLSRVLVEQRATIEALQAQLPKEISK